MSSLATNLFRCGTCREAKVRIAARNPQKVMDEYRYWHDEKGAPWFINNCPSCAKEIAGTRGGLGSTEPLHKPKVRKCRKCGGDTPNYFHCSTCLSRVEEHGADYEAYLDGGSQFYPQKGYVYGRARFQG
jgi:hypothetical protein